MQFYLRITKAFHQENKTRIGSGFYKEVGAAAVDFVSVAALDPFPWVSLVALVFDVSGAFPAVLDEESDRLAPDIF